MSSATMPILQQREYIRSKVKGLVNADLREICRLEGLRVAGVKKMLQDRILEKLEGLVQTGDVEGLNQLRYNIENPLARYKNPRPQPPAPAASHPQPSSSNTQNNYGQRSVNGYGSSSSPSMPRRGPSYGSTTPLIAFKSSPFYDQRDVLATANIPVCVNHRAVAKTHIPFNPQQVERLRQDSALRVLLYCGESVSPNSPASDVAFPANIELRVNGQEVKTNTKGIKGKPGSTRPADITAFIKRQSGAGNILEVTYALTQKSYTMVVMMVGKKSVNDLQTIIEKRRVITKHQVLQDMRARANDPDIVATSTVMSLKDPVSYMRMTLPCRGTRCSHNQCFDALSFLQLQEQAPVWTCPICSKHIPFEDLVVDQYVQEILQMTSSSTDQVTIEPDGKWYQGSAKANGAGPTPKDEDDDDDDSDDLVEITDFRPTNPKVESPNTPLSLTTQTPPVRNENAYPGSSATPSSGPRGQKRQSVVIDLTLSDDDEAPAPKRPTLGGYTSTSTNSILDRASTMYNYRPFASPSSTSSTAPAAPVPSFNSLGTNRFSPFQLGTSRTSPIATGPSPGNQHNGFPAPPPNYQASQNHSPSPFMHIGQNSSVSPPASSMSPFMGYQLPPPNPSRPPSNHAFGQRSPPSGNSMMPQMWPKRS